MTTTTWEFGPTYGEVVVCSGIGGWPLLVNNVAKCASTPELFDPRRLRVEFRQSQGRGWWIRSASVEGCRLLDGGLGIHEFATGEGRPDELQDDTPAELREWIEHHRPAL